MCKYQVHEERNGDDNERGSDEQVTKAAEIGIAGEKSKRDAHFPSQEIGALRGAALTMTAQLDEKQ